jgi:glycerophosphoryl diester phosphodiesterase
MTLPLILGHRGASVVHKENTLDAFVAARELGADGVELDVRRTADGAMAVHHDAHFADGRLIVETPATALPSDVPMLRDALVACGPMTVNIEIKNVAIDPDYDPEETIAASVVALVGELAIGEQIIVSCFGIGAIDKVRELEPSLRTGWLTIPQFDHLRALETVVEHGHSALHAHYTAVTPELVEAAHAAGVALNTWTVDNPDDMRRMADYGVDAIVTNDVALAVQVLRKD